MSSKVVNVTTSDIKKSFTATASTHVSQRNKADFKLKRFTGAKSEFGVSTLCAGSVFGLSGLKD
jgi:hypothetical protein